MSNKQQCPEFPYFGAKYPDATCIDGYLWDLDSCDEPHCGLKNGGEVPCPFCNTESSIEYHDDGEPGSREKLIEDIQKLKEKYDSQNNNGKTDRQMFDKYQKQTENE